MEFAREAGPAPGNVTRSSTSPSFIDATVDFFAGKYENFMRNRAFHKSVRVLSELDDHILKDIGVDRGSIMATAYNNSRNIEVNRF